MEKTKVLRNRLSGIAFLVFLLILLPAAASAGTVQVAQTGQTKCYDSSGTVIACAGAGQDGEIQAGVAWPSPRFTDNGDQTQTDNLTKLIWPKDGGTPSIGSCTGGQMTWHDALNYVACLNAHNFLGHNDWRLPNANELESIVAGGQSDAAAWLNGQGFSNVKSFYYYYWSSTSYAFYVSNAWYVNMGGGNISAGSKAGYNDYVWPVRGGQDTSVVWQTGQTTCYDTTDNVIACAGTGQDGAFQEGVSWPSPRFTDNGNQTVTDNLTKLMWTKNADAPGPSACNPGTYMTWQGALNYVACLNVNNYLGHNDWRLPNRTELRSLSDFSQYNPSLPTGNPFTNVQSSYYWSSTSEESNPSFAWIVDMSYGDVNVSNKTYNEFFFIYAWPVRGTSEGDVSPVNGTMQVPADQMVLPPYAPVAGPFVSTDPYQAEPIGVGSVASGGDILSLQVGLPRFSGPVDVYFGIFAPSIAPNNVYLLKSDNTLQALSTGFAPWQNNIFGNINNALLGNIPISSLPPGPYTFYLVVAPAGSLNSFYLWSTSITVGGSIGGNAPYISALVLKKTGVSDLLRVQVCFDSTCGTPITDATVTVNGTPLPYNGTYYKSSTGAPAAGQAVNLSVTVPGGDGVAPGTYTATGTQYSDFPTVASPTSGAIWDPAVNNTVNWTPGVPSAGAQYHVAIRDGNGHFYPTLAQGSIPVVVPVTSTSYTVSPNTIPAGTYSVTVGIETANPIPISGAVSGSGLYIGGVSTAQTLTVQGSSGGGIGSNWTTQASGTSNDLYGVTWSGSQFVAVGANGTILTSSDGVNWTLQASGTSYSLSSITWSGSKFVAVGGVIVTSPDGVKWTTQESGLTNGLLGVTTNNLFSVAWSGSKFAAVGIDDTILTSPDGVNWAQVSGPSTLSSYTTRLCSIAWSGSKFVAVGYYLRGDDIDILTSPDGTTWTVPTPLPGNSEDLSGITWSGSKFVVVGSLFPYGGDGLTSPDGVNWAWWTSGAIPYYFNGITWSGTQFVAVATGASGTGAVLTSPDGENWAPQVTGFIKNPAASPNGLRGVACSAAKCVAVGDFGAILTSP
jgi:Protein of unknown function (DUF1566)